jgi:hypothetical protein
VTVSPPFDGATPVLSRMMPALLPGRPRCPKGQAPAPMLVLTRSAQCRTQWRWCSRSWCCSAWPSRCRRRRGEAICVVRRDRHATRKGDS